MSDRSDRPVWLGEDERGWDHARIHRRLLEDDRVGAYEIAVYVGLAIHAETRSGSARPAAATLARYAKMGDRRARQAIDTLADAGWIEVRERPGKASSYVLLPPPTLAPAAEVTPAPDAAHPGTTGRAPLQDVPRTPAPGADEREPRTRAKDESQEQGAEAGALFQVEPAQRPLAAGERVPGFEFEDWYRLFPLHRGRGQAERAYQAARRLATADELKAGAERYAAEQAAPLPTGEFRPATCHPATWLNGKRWLDEATTKPTGPQRGTGSAWDRSAESGAIDPEEL